MNVNSTDKLIYHVKGVHNDRVMNIKRKTCTCRRFQLDLLSCAYAAIVIRSYDYHRCLIYFLLFLFN